MKFRCIKNILEDDLAVATINHSIIGFCQNTIKDF